MWIRGARNFQNDMSALRLTQYLREITDVALPAGSRKKQGYEKCTSYTAFITDKLGVELEIRKMAPALRPKHFIQVGRGSFWLTRNYVLQKESL
ncbi:hypothetical protein BpJC4_20760 [Weizmannia acidilactici]|nr:hypothetical protein BpJC4_20760 [Weizmannia acidilactici]